MQFLILQVCHGRGQHGKSPRLRAHVMASWYDILLMIPFYVNTLDYMTYWQFYFDRLRSWKYLLTNYAVGRTSQGPGNGNETVNQIILCSR